MPFRPEVLEILACPQCHGKLELRTDESAFDCRKCRVAYPVEKGIPVFLIDEAIPATGDGGDDRSA
ncbi:MAG: Trm112 family protein [Planctomycetota bacterium]